MCLTKETTTLKPRGITIKRRPLLTEEDCHIIHEGTCRLLEETGIHVTNQEAARIFTQNGAELHDGERITIPRDVIEEKSRQTESRIELGAKNSANDLTIEAGVPRIFFGTGGQALYILEKNNGGFQRRSAGTGDLEHILQLCEQLPHVDFITRPVEPDVPEEDMDLEKIRIFLRYTTKHMNLANLVRLDKLPAILKEVEDPSLISFISCVCISPLKLASGTLDKFIRLVEEDIPVSISSCPQAGLTAPLSELGELIQVNAEVLSVIILANMIRPGARVLYRGIPITSNLHEDISPRWCQPECIRRVALIADMTAYYGIPCCGTAAVSDEKKPTAQAVSEKTLGWIYESLSGASFINSALGMLEQVMTVSPEQYVMDNRILAAVKPMIEENGDSPTADLAEQAVSAALELFGVHADEPIREEIRSRIRFIETKREKYTLEAAGDQVTAITKAVLSNKSSNLFLKTSRSGLRKGLLYMGRRIERPLDLSDVEKEKQRLLAG